jgi:hypothetical protein
MTKLPKGKYWVGDPCYVLDHNSLDLNFNWQTFCDFCFKDDPSGRKNEGVVDHQDIRFAFHGTAYGDGSYHDKDGNEYGVDAGCISCIPMEAIEGKADPEWMNRLGTVHEFKSDFTSSYCDGTITFGHVVIETGDSPNDDYWYDEDEDEDEDEDY